MKKRTRKCNDGVNIRCSIEPWFMQVRAELKHLKLFAHWSHIHISDSFSLVPSLPFSGGNSLNCQEPAGDDRSECTRTYHYWFERKSELERLILCRRSNRSRRRNSKFDLFEYSNPESIVQRTSRIFSLLSSSDPSPTSSVFDVHIIIIIIVVAVVGGARLKEPVLCCRAITLLAYEHA